MRGRAFRRDQEQKAKKKARRLWRQWMGGWDRLEEPTDRWVGVMASTHCAPCSCFGCRWPKGQETQQEKASKLALVEQYAEFWEDWRDWQTRLNNRRSYILWMERRLVEARAELVELEAARWPCYPW